MTESNKRHKFYQNYGFWIPRIRVKDINFLFCYVFLIKKNRTWANFNNSILQISNKYLEESGIRAHFLH